MAAKMTWSWPQTLSLGGLKVQLTCAAEEITRRPIIVCLHNGTGCSSAWRRFAKTFAAEGYCLVAYDRRGYGGSAPIVTKDLPREFLREAVHELVCLLDHFSLDACCLVGHSDGASIALMTAALHPDRVSCVVAEAPHMKIGEHSSMLQCGFDAFETGLGTDPRYRAAMQRDHGEQWHHVEDRWKRYWRNPAFQDWDQMALLGKILCPTLVIHGEDDPFWPAQHSHKIAEGIQRSEVALISDVGHSVHQEQELAFNKIVREFLSGHWPNNASRL